MIPSRRTPTTCQDGETFYRRAGDGGLTYLAYGTRDPGDMCHYPRSNKINFRGVGLIARLDALEYADGESEFGG